MKDVWTDAQTLVPVASSRAWEEGDGAYGLTPRSITRVFRGHTQRAEAAAILGITSGCCLSGPRFTRGDAVFVFSRHWRQEQQRRPRGETHPLAEETSEER